MRWTCLGHAMWLAEAGNTRIVMDPLLGETCHDGVFRTHPARRIDVDALKPDLIVVTHRHPDHFDVPSLHRLAQQDPTSVVLTSDELVASSCRRLGFHNVGILAVGDVVPLKGATLTTTPSLCKVVEWGVVVATDDGVVWNQVDTVLNDAATAQGVWDDVNTALGRSGPATALIAQWQPLREVEPHIYGRLDFPRAAYAQALARAAALRPGHLIPGAAGHHHVGAASWLNAHAYPVSEDRFLRDLARLAPELPTSRAKVGATWQVHAGRLSRVEQTASLVTQLATPDERRWAPFALPELVGGGTADDRELVHTWVELALRPALAARLRAQPTLTVGVDVLWSDTVDAWSFTHADDGVGMARVHDPEWDSLDRIHGGELARVLRGEAHWGRPLLAGLLRHYERCDAHAKPVGGRRIALYDALPYERATERWVEHQLSECGG